MVLVWFQAWQQMPKKPEETHQVLRACNQRISESFLVPASSNGYDVRLLWSFIRQLSEGCGFESRRGLHFIEFHGLYFCQSNTYRLRIKAEYAKGSYRIRGCRYSGGRGIKM